MKEIKLTQGKVALVDDEDFEYLNQFKWYAHKNGNTYYAQRHIRINKKQKSVTIHGSILNNKMTDHIDGDGLNCQKYNLRSCTNQQNQHNQRPRLNCTSKYKGVHWYKRDKKWLSMIMLDGKHYNLGKFIDEIEAAKAYDKKAIELFGEFAHLNFR